MSNNDIVDYSKKKDFHISCSETFSSGNRVHKIGGIKIIYVDDTLSVLIRFKKKDAFVAWSCFCLLVYDMHTYTPDLIISLNNLALYVTKIPSNNKQSQNYWEIFKSGLINDTNTITIDTSKSKNSVNFFKVNRQKCIWVVDETVLDDENFLIETSRWDAVNRGDMSDTDEEV